MTWYDAELTKTDFERHPALKLEAGTHEVRVLSEGREVAMQDYDGNPTVKLVLDVLYQGKPFAWFVTIGKRTTDSLFGQLAAIAKAKAGLREHVLHIAVAGRGKAKRYQVIDVDGTPVVDSTTAPSAPARRDYTSPTFPVRTEKAGLDSEMFTTP